MLSKRTYPVIACIFFINSVVAQTQEMKDSTNEILKEKYSFNKHFTLGISAGASFALRTGTDYKGDKYKPFSFFPIGITAYYAMKRTTMLFGLKSEFFNFKNKACNSCSFEKETIFYPFIRYEFYEQNNLSVYLGLDYDLMKKNNYRIGLQPMIDIIWAGYPFGEFSAGMGISCESKLNDNISLFLQTTAKIDFWERIYGIELSLQTGVKLNFKQHTALSQYSVKDTTKKHTYSIALGTALNLSPEKYTGSHDGYPYYFTYFDSTNSLAYKNAFGYVFSSFPVMEFSLIGEKLKMHTIGGGYLRSRSNRYDNGQYMPPDIGLSNINIYYKFSHPICKIHKNKTLRGFFYSGVKLSVNYKKLYSRSYGTVNDSWDSHQYKDELLLNTMQLPLGYRLHNKLFYDIGLNVNVFAYVTGRFDYFFEKGIGSVVDLGEYTFQDDYKKWLFLYPHLWNDRYIFNNLFFKIGYKF
ncbi:MAG: hypothetical protein ABII90_02725 [Bacteroidota bacterium]